MRLKQCYSFLMVSAMVKKYMCLKLLLLSLKRYTHFKKTTHDQNTIKDPQWYCGTRE